MEEINLELEKNNHKTFNFNNSAPSTGDLNVIREKKDVDIGLDLLINKSKVGGDSPKPVEEFKPSEPIKPRTPSPSQPLSISLENTNTQMNNPPSGINELSIEKELDLSDIGITDTPLNNVSTDLNLSNHITSSTI